MKDDVAKNSKGKKRFKRRNKFASRKDEQVAETRSSAKSEYTNDIQWYSINDALLRDAGSYSFNNPLGNSLRINEYSQFDSSITWNNVDLLDSAVPGIMDFKFIPTYGGAQRNLPNAVDANTPINVAAKGIYSAVRKDNSGAKNYEPADLMKFLIALDSILMVHAYIRRIYGLARVYSSVNRYWPKAIITAMNVDFDDIMLHLPDMRYYLNAMASKINRFCIPEVMYLYQRHYSICSGVYRDDFSDKSQLYQFTPRWVYKYNELNTPATLDPVMVGDAASKFNFNSLIGLFNELFDPFMASEDIGIINGDMFKAMGMNNRLIVDPVDIDYEVVPQYDAVILSQIQNMTICGGVMPTPIKEGTTVGLDDGILYQELSTIQQYTTMHLGHPLNIVKDIASITPGDVMEATRLTVHGITTFSSDTKFNNVITACGTEVVCLATIWTLNKNGQPLVLANFNNNTNLSVINADVISSFNMHPYFVRMSSNADTGGCEIATGTLHAYDYDWDNYTIIGDDGLTKLHECAVLSEFGVPFEGQFKFER